MHSDTSQASVQTENAPADTAGGTGIAEGVAAEELLIEEISIDGMCGVY